MADTITLNNMTHPYSQSRLSDEADVTLRIFEYEQIPDGVVQDDDDEENAERTVRIRVVDVTDLAVSKKVVCKNSLMLNRMLGSGPWKETKQDIVELHEDTFISTAAMILWLSHMHGTADLASNSNSVSREDLWSIVAAGPKYALKLSQLNDWFKSWFTQNENMKEWMMDDCKQLLYPCFIFGHSLGFIRATKYLVYNVGSHIKEENPTVHRHLHLPQRVIREHSAFIWRSLRDVFANIRVEQLNAARGRLRIILLRELWHPITVLRKSQCTCKAETVFWYLGALENLGVWPMEQKCLRRSMNDILDKLRQFKWNPDEKSCSTCKTHFSNVVPGAISTTAQYFDGLCLVCMDYTNPKTGSSENDYWVHDEMEDWDSECGVDHGQPSWYYSYMGRKQHKDAKDLWYEDH